MQFTLFQPIFDGVMTPIIAQMTAMMGQMSATMQPIALVAVSIWVCFATWDFAAGAKTLTEIGREAFRVMMFYMMVRAGSYTQYVSDLFLNAIPNTISASMGGTGTPAAMLDTLCGQALSQASTVYEAVPAYSFKGALLTIAVMVFVLVALVCVAFMFIVLCVAGLTEVLALVVGPVFLTCATMPWTRKFASGWLAVLVGGCVTQLMGLALIRLLVGSSAALIAQLTASAVATNSNSIVMLVGLGKIGVLLWLFKKVTEKLPELAHAIGGGVYHGTNAAFASFAAGSAVGAVMLGGAAGGVGGAVRGAIAGGGGGASGATIGAITGGTSGAGRGAAFGFRYLSPAGRSLSRGFR